MLLVFRLWLFIQISITSGNHFTFDATNLVSTTDNWLHEEIPCIGDRIRFDNTVPVVAFMDHNVNVESIQLPDNGLIVFTDNGVDLGGDANWQCEKFNENAKDVFFNRDSRHDISFYNPANWIPEQRRFLHMNQVPSEEVVFLKSPISASNLRNIHFFRTTLTYPQCPVLKSIWIFL
uniref:Protein amnionless n=1 Tax=Caenorhabditis tropicalis TaxID=1561998 RepID=A0A1I7T4X9_9PELO